MPRMRQTRVLDEEAGSSHRTLGQRSVRTLPAEEANTCHGGAMFLKVHKPPLM